MVFWVLSGAMTSAITIITTPRDPSRINGDSQRIS
jgi:hypothetical protein